MLCPFCNARYARTGLGGTRLHVEGRGYDPLPLADIPFDWDAHKRSRNMRKAQTIYSRSDEDLHKDRLKREKAENDGKAIDRAFNRSAPMKPTMHERLMPYRSRG